MTALCGGSRSSWPRCRCRRRGTRSGGGRRPTRRWRRCRTARSWSSGPKSFSRTTNSTATSAPRAWRSVEESYQGGTMKSRSYAVAIVFILWGAAAARAQTTSGTITGIVTDPSNAVVPGAQITLTNRATGLQRETLASDAGEYRVPLLPPGLYTIKVEATGFKTEVVKDVKLETLQTARVDFRLELGDVREVMTVEGRTPLLETEATTTGTVIKNEQVTNLPLNVRQFMQMVFLSPFAIPAARDFRSTEVARDTAVPSGGGARPEDNNYQVDGFDNQESGRHGFAISPPVDSIAEFKVQAGTAPADFGRGSGTMVNVVTKGGTNELHGSLYEFLRNDLFDARPFFATRRSPLK